MRDPYSKFTETIHRSLKDVAPDTGELKREVIDEILDVAHTVAKHYEPKVTKKKGVDGSIDGAVAGAAALAGIVASRKISPEAGEVVQAVSGILFSAVVTGIQKMIRNWLKHRRRN